jgi:transcriptional regulator with XRE-family HTH domain
LEFTKIENYTQGKFMMKLREYIEKEGLRKDLFAKKLGISAATLSNWLMGRTEPKIAQALRIQRLTKGYVKIKYWLCDEDAKENKAEIKESEKD